MSSEASVEERFVHARRHLEHKAIPGGLNPGLKWWRWGRVELPAWCSSSFAGVRRSRNFRPFGISARCHDSSSVVGVGVRIDTGGEVGFCGQEPGNFGFADTKNWGFLEGVLISPPVSELASSC